MKDTLFIILFGVLIYLGTATVFGDSSLMGSYGATFAMYNQLYFGYFSFTYLFIALFPLYFLYKNTTFDFRKAELTIASFLVMFSVMLAQSLVVENELRGKFAADFTDFLSPYIGLFGLWIFWIIISLVSVVIILDKSTSEIVSIILSFIEDKSSSLVEKRETNDDNAEIEETVFENLDTNEEVTEELNVVDEDENLEIDKPAYLRQEESIHTKVKEDLVEEKADKKSKNILDLVEEVKEQKNAIIVDELEENAKLLADIDKGKVDKPKNFKLPSVNFLQKAPKTAKNIDESELDDKIRYLIEKLAHFKIDGDVVRTYAGPVVSTFEFKPAANVKVSKILGLQDDLAMALSAETIRIQAPIPGRDVVGIEIPNDSFDTIYLRDILESEIFTTSKSPLTIAMGKDIVGNAFVTDLKRLPHLLIAGTTGSGKSVGINAMILSLLYRNDPDSLKLMLIDPKMLEFSIYNDIPHLITPVITDAVKAIAALSNMVGEMERRYKMMAETRTKNIDTYNEKMKKRGQDTIPFIVVVIDELADLMMNGGKDVEYSIARLAQMARASGIHLIVATQRPSVDVVTGLIKANLPSRLSYRVGQRIDSKVILDALGADSLLGKGDALFTPPGTNGLVRIHAPWNSEEEVEQIVEFLKEQRAPDYDERYLVPEDGNSLGGTGIVGDLDEFYEKAKEIILTDQKTSISYLQRKLQIGYNRSANIIEQLQEMGILSAPNNKGQREILL